MFHNSDEKKSEEAAVKMNTVFMTEKVSFFDDDTSKAHRMLKELL